MTRSFRVWSVLCGLVLWLSVSSTAFAQETKRVVVLDFRGPSAGAVRNEVVAALKKKSDVELVPQSALNGAESGSALRSAAAEAQVSAVIEGRVAKKGKLLRVTVKVRDTDTGEVVKEEEWVRKKPQIKNLEGAVWGALGSSIMGTRAPEKKADAPVSKREQAREPEREREEEPREEREEAREERTPEPAREEAEPEAEESASKSPGSFKHPALVVSVGPRMMWRALEYKGDTTLSSYSSYADKGGTPAFNAAVNVLWFPGAHFRSDWVSDIGLEADLDYSLLLKSKQGSKELDTTAYEFSIGALYRIPLEMFEPRLRVGYLMHTFDVDVPAGTLLPAVSYSAVRLGVGTLVRVIDAFNFDVGFNVLMVLDTGDIGSADYASKASAWAWELGGGATYSFLERFGVRVGVDYRRYAIDMKGTNANLVLPKEATDSYLRATASFVYTLPGR